MLAYLGGLRQKSLPYGWLHAAFEPPELIANPVSNLSSCSLDGCPPAPDWIVAVRILCAKFDSTNIQYGSSRRVDVTSGDTISMVVSA